MRDVSSFWTRPVSAIPTSAQTKTSATMLHRVRSRLVRADDNGGDAVRHLRTPIGPDIVGERAADHHDRVGGIARDLARDAGGLSEAQVAAPGWMAAVEDGARCIAGDHMGPGQARQLLGGSSGAGRAPDLLIDHQDGPLLVRQQRGGPNDRRLGLCRRGFGVRRAPQGRCRHLSRGDIRDGVQNILVENDRDDAEGSLITAVMASCTAGISPFGPESSTGKWTLLTPSCLSSPG